MTEAQIVIDIEDGYDGWLSRRIPATKTTTYDVVDVVEVFCLNFALVMSVEVATDLSHELSRLLMEDGNECA